MYNITVKTLSNDEYNIQLDTIDPWQPVELNLTFLLKSLLYGEAGVTGKTISTIEESPINIKAAVINSDSLELVSDDLPDELDLPEGLPEEAKI